MDILSLFFKGGVVMYPLLAASIIVWMIAIERIFFLRKQKGDATSLTGDLTQAMERGAYGEALALCQTHGGAAAEVLRLGLSQIGEPCDQRELIEGEARKKALELRAYLEYLSVIVTMAPLLGLGGTVRGMIQSFSVFSLSEGQPFAITGGVGEALIATATGLLVAIMALALHAYLSHRANTIIAQVEYAATRYLAVIGGR